MITSVNPMWMPHMVIVACCLNMDTVWHDVAAASVVACKSNFVAASLNVLHAVVPFFISCMPVLHVQEGW